MNNNILSVAALVSLFICNGAISAKSVSETPTHKEVSSISINLDEEFSKAKIHTFAITPEGKILAACGGSTMVYQRKVRGGGKYVEKEMPAAIFVLDNAGEILDIWRLSITPQALTVDKDGTVYAAGQGMVIKLDKDGREIQSAVAPHVQASEELLAVLNRNKGESVPEKPKVKEGKKSLLKSITDSLRPKSSGSNNSALRRKLAVNGMAVNDSAVYITCPQPKGYGYAIYQMTKDLKDPEMITKGLRGCCGQMDIQAYGNFVYAAENSRFRVVGFDSKGKEVFKIDGAKKKRGSLEGFGSCCNPMNLRFDNEGNIYTAEASVGRIKKYSPDGKLLEVVGTIKVIPGCKNVAIDFYGDYAYMLDITRNKIAVLKRK